MPASFMSMSSFHGSQIPSPCAAEGELVPPALQAHFRRMRELRPGLHLHADDAVESSDFTAQAQMNEALRIVLLLEGEVDLSYGVRDVRLNAGSGCGGAAATLPGNALLVSVAEPELFVRRGRRGGYARRVSVGLSPEWIEQALGGRAAPALQSFMRQHLALHSWQISERARAIAEQIVRPPVLDSWMQNLYLESRTLELVAQAFATLPGMQSSLSDRADGACAGLRPHEHKRLREVRELLSGPRADALCLDDIARHAGVNANTLQRQFRALYGTTIFDYLRETRLQRARAALERDGITVGQAAVLAGYSGAANFATAYKRRFGIVPKLARSRV